MKIYLYYVGKARDAHANAMADEYIKRSGRFAKCEMREIQPRRFDPWTKHPAATKVLLDPVGRTVDSQGFIALVDKAARDAHDLVFIVGGSDGLPPEWKSRPGLLLSLTPMTLPHELARVVLAEQIYRGINDLPRPPVPALGPPSVCRESAPWPFSATMRGSCPTVERCHRSFRLARPGIVRENFGGLRARIRHIHRAEWHRPTPCPDAWPRLEHSTATKG